MIEHINGEAFSRSSNKQWVIVATKGNTTIATITNENLTTAGQITLDEGLCDTESLEFGSFMSAKLSFSVRNTMASLIDCTLTVSLILDHDDENPFSVGVYKVTSDKPDADRKTRKIEAYDALYEIINADVAGWYQTVFPNDNSTTTVKLLRDSFFDHFGITQNEVTLINDSLSVPKTLNVTNGEDGELATLSGKDILKGICEANGCFGRIGRDGTFEYVYLSQNIIGLYPNMPDDALKYPHESGLYPIFIDSNPLTNSEYEPPCDYDDYLTGRITQLEIKNSDGSAILWEGSEGNTYTIEKNFIFYGRTANSVRQAAENILSKIEGISYRPYSTSARGNLLYEVGDPIRISTKYCLIESYILKRTFSGLQVLKDSYSAQGVEKYTVDVTETSKKTAEEINRLRHEYVSSNEELYSRIIDETRNNFETAIEQTVDGIGLYVKDGSIETHARVQAEGLYFSGGHIVINTSNFSISPSGDVTIKGSIQAGSTISGARFIQNGDGYTFEIKDGGIEFVESNGSSTPYFKIDGAGFVLNVPYAVGSKTVGFTLNRSSLSFTKNWRLTSNGLVEDTSYDGETIFAPGRCLINGKKIATEDIISTQATDAVDYYLSGHDVTNPLHVAVTTAMTVENRLDTKDKLSANVDDPATNESLINIGTAYKAVTLRYFNHHAANSASDRKLKEDIEDVNSKCVEIVDKLQLKNFRFKENNKSKKYGLIAQDVQSILEDLGIDDSDIVVTNKDESGEEYLGIDYPQLLSLLIPAYQNLRKDHDDLVNLLKEKGVID